MLQIILHKIYCNSESAHVGSSLNEIKFSSMKNKITIVILGLIYSFNIFAQSQNEDVFKLINLNYKGLEKVKTLYETNKKEEALTALLEYYRSKKDFQHPDIDFNNITISSSEQKWAEDGMKHIFYVNKAYQPAYFYGEDINWKHWPIKENELRWQLHRMYWWLPMGKVYQKTKDEKYAQEWIHQYGDWIKKNPLDLRKHSNNDPDADVAALDNVRFAWRALEVSHRIQDQTILFQLFLNSPNFTPQFLEEFLINYSKHVEHLKKNYSKQGNHLLFEAQRIIYAGSCFPEFEQAEVWRKNGIEVLQNAMKKQVYDDGVQYELDPSYHLASINIFLKAARMAQVKGFANDFPEWYYQTMESMINFMIDITFPDYTYPLFSDSRLTEKRVMLRDLKNFKDVFPTNKLIAYWASDKKTSFEPQFLSNQYPIGGFYIFRNNWTENATQMIVKAGPPAEWHNQPDNGTFNLFMKGRNFFIDSGSYMYGGDADALKQREWFKQTRVHNTLTLDNKNIEETNSKLLKWQTSDNLDLLVTENPSYKELNHRRSIFFVDKKYFIIVDEAIGHAKGEVGIHYNLSEGKVDADLKKMEIKTQYKDKNNLLLQVFAPKTSEMLEEEGWVSYQLRSKAERPAYVAQVVKKDSKTVRFISVLAPIENNETKMKVTAKIDEKNSSQDSLSTIVEINGKKYNLGYQLKK